MNVCCLFYPLQGAILSEEDAEELRPKESRPKGKKGKKSKKDFADAFDALGLEEEPKEGPSGSPEPSLANGKHHDAAEPSGNGAATAEHNNEKDALDLLPRQKKGSKKKKGVDIAGAFAALAVEDDGEGRADSREEDEEGITAEARGFAAQATTSEADADEVVLSGSKKGEYLLNASCTGKRSEFSCCLPSISYQMECGCKAGGKKKKKQADADIDALLAAIHESPPEVPAAENGMDAEQVSGAKKKKKKKDKEFDDINALLADINGEAEATAAGQEEEQQPASASTTSPIDAPSAPQAAEEGSSKAKKGKKKGKQVCSWCIHQGFFPYHLFLMV